MTNNLFLENMHFKAPQKVEIMKEEFIGLVAQLLWGEEKNVRFLDTKVNYAKHEPWEIKDCTLERPFSSSKCTEYFYFWFQNSNCIYIYVCVHTHKHTHTYLLFISFESLLYEALTGCKQLFKKFFIFKKQIYYNLLLTKLNSI